MGDTLKVKIMNIKTKSSARVLVIEDIEETRDGIEILLSTDGYQVEPARSLETALPLAIRVPPDLILVSLPGPVSEIVEAAHRLRVEAHLELEKVPVVIFCVEEVPSGEEIGVGQNIYLTHLDNFNQLRNFFKHLLR